MMKLLKKKRTPKLPIFHEEMDDHSPILKRRNTGLT